MSKQCTSHRASVPVVQIRSPSMTSLNGEAGEAIALKRLPSKGGKTQISGDSSADQRQQRPATPRLFLLYGIIILQLAIFVTELVTDNFTHSLLILTDAYHHLFNACNAILLVLSFKISNQVTVKNTFGWVRVELLGMMTTITFIVALIFSLLIEGALQLLHLHEIAQPTDFNVLLIFGVWSLLVNFLYVLIINGMITETKYKSTTRTERSFSTVHCEPSTSVAVTSTSLEVNAGGSSDSSSSSADTNNNRHKSPRSRQLPSGQQTECFFGSLLQGVLSPVLLLLASAAIFLLQRQTLFEEVSQFVVADIVNMVDPLMGVIMAIILCISFLPLMKNTTLILMQTVPENVNIVQLKKELLEKFSALQNIHEFHIWRLTSANIVATCHIVLPRLSTREYTLLFESIKAFLSAEYGIVYVTIQPEFSNWNAAVDGGDDSPVSVPSENECFMKCPKKGDCAATCDGMTCCNSHSDLNSVAIIGGHGHSHGGKSHGHSHGHGHAH